jgi:GNAT superfamily N-acetyltransferase
VPGAIDNDADDALSAHRDGWDQEPNSPVRAGISASSGQHLPAIRPATGADLDDLQVLARRMMIDPDRHRRGLGRRLLRHAEETLLARYASIRLESFADNAAANSFYEACGWRHGDRLEGEGPTKVEYVKNARDD